MDPSARSPPIQDLHPIPPPPDPTTVGGALLQAAAVFDGQTPDLIVVNDPQRATASALVLSEAAACGMLHQPDLLIATGSHRFDARQRQAFEGLFDALSLGTCLWHDARSTGHVVVGGSLGWRAHPRLASARRVLAIGSVEPHYFAGFSGAHKTLTIGCAAFAEIERNHAGALQGSCRPCRLDGTPVYEGLVQMLQGLAADRVLAAVNLFQIGETIVGARGGAPLASLRALCPSVEAAWLRRIPEPADALVVEVTGALSCCFYQAEKGIKNCEWAVRDGGVIVLVAACPQGLGQDAFTGLLREAASHAQALEVIARRGYRLGDHKAVRLRFLTDPSCRGLRLFLVSPGLCSAEAALLGGRMAPSVEAALELAGVDAEAPRVYRLHDAGNLCLTCDRA